MNHSTSVMSVCDLLDLLHKISCKYNRHKNKTIKGKYIEQCRNLLINVDVINDESIHTAGCYGTTLLENVVYTHSIELMNVFIHEFGFDIKLEPFNGIRLLQKASDDYDMLEYILRYVNTSDLNKKYHTVISSGGYILDVIFDKTIINNDIIELFIINGAKKVSKKYKHLYELYKID